MRTTLVDPSLDFNTIIDHSADGLRSGEGSIAVLNDGSLLLLYTQFTGGGGDADRSHIVSCRSLDDGRTWSGPEVVFTPPAGALNVMSVSVLRLADGRLGCAHAVKWDAKKTGSSMAWTTSDDEGRTWREAQQISPAGMCISACNDRLVQLSDGTIVIPYRRRPRKPGDEGFDPTQTYKRICGLLYSRDGGATWLRSPHEIDHSTEYFTMPPHYNLEHMDAEKKRMLTNRLSYFHEPSIVELKDGRILMVMRSWYGVYTCLADSVTGSWQNCLMIPDLNVCSSPQAVKRLPNSDRIVMFYNDRGDTHFETIEFQLRNPFSVAISDDDGQTWQPIGNLEGDAFNTCYWSLLFYNDRFISTYYQSVPREEEKKQLPEAPIPDAAPAPKGRRNLANLRVCRGPASIFKK